MKEARKKKGVRGADVRPSRRITTGRTAEIQRAKVKDAAIAAARVRDSVHGVAVLIGEPPSTIFDWYRNDLVFRAAMDEALIAGAEAVHAHRLETARLLSTEGLPSVTRTVVQERNPDTGEMVVVKDTAKEERVIEPSVLLRGLSRGDPGWRSHNVQEHTGGVDFSDLCREADDAPADEPKDSP